MMEVRPVGLSDLDAVVRLQAEAMVASEAYPESVDESAVAEHLRPRVKGYFDGSYHPSHAMAPRAMFVAVTNGRIVGFVAGHLSTRMGCEGELQWIFVRPSEQRRGIGAALLRPMADWFKKVGGTHVIVDAPPGHPSRDFYRHFGALPLDSYWLHWPDIGRAPISTGAWLHDGIR